MSDPVSTDLSFMGLKFASLMAGIVGGMLSLSFLRPLTTTQSIMAVFTGGATAIYITPVAIYYFPGGPLPQSTENFMAFVIGLTAMNIIPGLIKISEIFRKNPSKFIDIKGGGK